MKKLKDQHQENTEQETTQQEVNQQEIPQPERPTRCCDVDHTLEMLERPLIDDELNRADCFPSCLNRRPVTGDARGPKKRIISDDVYKREVLPRIKAQATEPSGKLYYTDEEELKIQQEEQQKITTYQCIPFFFKKAQNLFKKTFRIAVLAPNKNFNIEEVQEGFAKTLERCNLKLHIKRFDNTPGEEWLMRALYLPQIVREKYDIVVTIGNVCTTEAVNYLSTIPNPPRVVFTGVREFAQYNQNPEIRKFVTGIGGNFDIHMQAFLISLVKPNAKVIKIIYNPKECGGSTAYHKDQLKMHLEGFGMIVETIEVASTQEASFTNSFRLKGADLVIVLRDHTVIPSVRYLGDVCNTIGTTLLTSDLYSPREGAALGFGHFEDVFGIQAAEIVIALLMHDALPEEIAIKPIQEKHVLVVNSNVIYQQNLILNSQAFTLVNNTSMI